MKTHRWRLGIVGGLVMSGIAIVRSDRALTQSSKIIPDNTLGSESSVVVPLDSEGLPIDVIDGGAVQGVNVFHSLQEFNVSEGRGAYFSSPDAAIQNILARVTGTNRSEILGTLGTFGNSNPNLFLINPNGIVFGTKANLDVGGAFVASTANEIRLGETGRFSASEPETSNLLSVNPSALFFNALASQANIINRSTATRADAALKTSTGEGFFLNGNSLRSISGLQVLDNQSLSLVGGDVALEGGNLTAPEGRLEIGSVAGTGSVSLNQIDQRLALGYEGVQNFGDIKISGLVNASGEGGGGIQIQGRQLLMDSGSFIVADTTGAKDGGDIQIRATDSVVVDNAIIGTFVESQAPGNGGDISIETGKLDVIGEFGLISAGTLDRGNAGNITIQARQLSLKNGAEISASTFGAGNAGDINIRATELVEVTGVAPRYNELISKIASQVNSGTGTGGNLLIETNRLVVGNGAQIQAGTSGEGKGGSIAVNATQAVDIVDPNADDRTTGLFTGPRSTASGEGGDLSIKTNQLNVLGAEARVSTQVDGQATGDGGNILIEANKLSVGNGAKVRADTFGEGQGGTLTINTSESVELFGTDGEEPGGLFTGTFGNADAGNLTVDTRYLSIRDGATISASTLGLGNGKGGNLQINASESIELIGESPDGKLPSSIVTEAGRLLNIPNFDSQAAGGSLTIDTGELTVSDGATVSTKTYGAGNAGNIGITTQSLVLQNQAEIAASTLASGTGGSITVKANTFTGTNFGQLSAATFGSGQAGNVTVEVAESLNLANFSGLFASTYGEGDAGKVFVQAQNISLARGYIFSTVELEAEGKGGNIDIAAKSIFMNGGSEINASTFGLNDAGSISIKVDDSVALANRSGIFTTVQTGAIGNGGNIDIQARSLSLTNGSQLQAIVFRAQDNLPGGQGQGGDIRVNATESINLAGVTVDGYSSGLFTSTERGAIGDAGSVTVETRDFRVADGAVVDAITANSSAAGDITITANSFEAVSGGQVLTTTRSSGKAGSITLKIADSILISGSDFNFSDRLSQFGEDVVNNQGAASGIFANTTPDSTGNGGSIFIDPIEVNIADGAGIAVNSQGQGNGGNLTLQADTLNLDGGFLSAATASGTGGNVTLQITNSLQLRRNSEISAQATGTANGGNIDINTNFLLAFLSENNDIIANAAEGQGGEIQINAQGVFGTQFREQLNPSLSDINASSKFGIDGVVEINTPDVDLQNSLTQLAANFASPDQVVAGSCIARRNVERGSFTVTGTGGLPRNPYEAISGRYAVTSVQPLPGSSNVSSNLTPVEPPTTWKLGDAIGRYAVTSVQPIPGNVSSKAVPAEPLKPWKLGDPIQEAQGITVTADGRTIVGTEPQLVAVAKAQDMTCQLN